MASPLTALATANYGGRVDCWGATYANDAAGTGNLEVKTTDSYTGQAAGYECDETFLEFDTSGIPDTATIDSATLFLYGINDNSVTDFTLEVYAYDFGAAVTTADFRNSAALAALYAAGGLLASKSTAGGIADNAYTAFTSGAAFLAAINKIGNTRLIVASDRHRAVTTPTGQERIQWNLRTTSGKEPKLVVAYTEAATGCPKMTDHYSRLRR